MCCDGSNPTNSWWATKALQEQVRQAWISVTFTVNQHKRATPSTQRQLETGVPYHQLPELNRLSGRVSTPYLLRTITWRSPRSPPWCVIPYHRVLHCNLQVQIQTVPDQSSISSAITTATMIILVKITYATTTWKNTEHMVLVITPVVLSK